MLAVPTKKGKSADWGAPLRQYIAERFGEASADEQTENLAKLNQAREWVLSNSRKTDETSLENVKTYLRMLGAIEARFPIRETAINITFVWYDSFKPAKKFMHHNVASEKAAILFNYAAMESYAGMIQDRSLPEGNVSSTTHFLTAARYFQYLKDVFIPNKVAGPVTSDLSQEGLTMLTNLMLAQAQICLFEKAAKNKMKPTILSKLAAGVVSLYHKALSAISTPNLESIIDDSWETHIKFQMNCFEASAAYQHAKVLLEAAENTGEGYGERVGYLRLANAKCDSALGSSSKGTVSETQAAPVQALKTSIGKDLSKAEADNNNIYMDPVPDLSALEPPVAKLLASVDLSKIDSALVDPILPGSQIDEDANGANMFKDFLPEEVQMAVVTFRSHITSLIENATKVVSENEQNVKESLIGANLPATMEAGGGERGLPDATYAKILESVHREGGINGLKSTLLGNKKQADQLTAILYDCQQKLKVDEAGDIKNRQVWGPRWTLPTSQEASSFINKDCARFQGYLMEAKESDRLLLAKMDSGPIRKLLEDVSQPKEALDLMVPDPGVIDDDAKVEGLRSKLRMSYIKLQTHMQDVNTRLEDFKYDVSKANIVQELYKKNSNLEEIIKDSGQVEKITQEKLAALDEPFETLKHLAEENTALLSRVLTDNSEYLEARLKNSATKEREEVIARLENGIVEFQGFSKHIEDGKKFYANLSERVTKLQTLVNDHCLSRDLLAKEMEQNLRHGITPAQNTMAPVQMPLSTPYSGQVYNNPAQPSPAPAAAAPVVVAAVATPTPVTVAPSQPASSGGSLLDEMRKAQEEAEKNGTLDQMVGGKITEPAAPPKPTAEDDAKAAQTAMAIEQQQILDAIQFKNALVKSKNQNYDTELQQVKALLTETPDQLILDHLKATQGNVTLTISNIMDNVPVPKQKKHPPPKKGGFTLFRKKKDKTGGDAGNPKQPNSGGNTGGGGGGFSW